jgi:hypothetical protein
VISSASAVAGAGLGVVDVLLAVVVPAEEFEVFEVGGSAVGPVPDVMGLAVAGGTVAAGGLAVLVAGGECFPLRGRDGGGGAADVEDLGPAGEDDAAEVAVAGEELDHGLGEPSAGVPFGPRAGDQIKTGREALVDVK